MNIAEQLVEVIINRNPPFMVYESGQFVLKTLSIYYSSEEHWVARIMFPKCSVIKCISFYPKLVNVAFENHGNEKIIQIKMESDYWPKGSEIFTRILKAFEGHCIPKQSIDDEPLLEELRLL